MSDLSELIARVEKATGPDPEIENEIERLFGDVPLIAHGLNIRWPHYTSSLDAVVALVEREFDDREWAVGPDKENGCTWARIGNDNWDEANDDILGKGPRNQPALALLLAFLRAKHSGENKEPT